MPDRLQVLLNDYEMARDDERTHLQVQAAMFGVAVALIGLTAGALTQECRFGMIRSQQEGGSWAADPAQCTAAPDLVLGVAPILPLAMLAYIQMYATLATIRTFYMRGLEAELSEYSAGPLTALGDLPVPSYMAMTVEVASARRGRTGYRILGAFILAMMLIVFGGMTVYIGLHVDRPTQIFMILVYGPAVACLLTELAAATIGGRSMFLAVSRRFLAGPGFLDLPKARGPQAGSSGPNASTVAPRSDGQITVGRQRSLMSYLLLPRPDDLIKWTFVPLVYVFTAMSAGQWGNWQRALGLWLVFEYLIYSARYQWNDVRGLGDDLLHPERAARARLPVPPNGERSSVNASLLSAAIRLLIALLLGWATNMLPVILALIVGAFAIAIPYELLRGGDSGTGALKPSWRRRAIWVWVGLGYPLRAAVGFFLAGLSLATGTAVVGMVYFALFGVMFVLMTWVLEASSFCRIGPTGRWVAQQELKVKPHLSALLPYAGLRVELDEDDASNLMADPPAAAMVNRATGKQSATEWNVSGEDAWRQGGKERILQPVQVRRDLRSPWTWSYCLSAAIGGIFGDMLAQAAAASATRLTSLVACLMGAVLVVRLRNRWAPVAVVLAAVSATTVTASILGNAATPVITFVPWFFSTVVYVFFSNSSYSDLKSFGKQIRHASKGMIGGVQIAIVGQATANRLGLVRESRPKRPAPEQRLPSDG